MRKNTCFYLDPLLKAILEADGRELTRDNTCTIWEWDYKRRHGKYPGSLLMFWRRVQMFVGAYGVLILSLLSLWISCLSLVIALKC